MIEICGTRRGDFYIPFSEEDRRAGLILPEQQFLRIRITGSKKERAYRELCAYMGSCEYIASLGLNPNMASKAKVDHLTRLKCNFVEDTVFDENGLLHWIVKSLSYDNCDQPDSHEFIAKALENHAELAGLYDVEEYLKLLNAQ